MKRLIAFIMSVILCLSVVAATGISVLAETSEGYTITFYEDITKENILYKRSNVGEGEPIYLTFDFEEAKEGHTFVSWVDSENGEKISLTNGNIIIAPGKDAEYYGEWTINTYKLTYRGYGEVIGEYDVAFGTPADEMPIPEEMPKRNGYEFIEWSALPVTMPSNNITVAARWRDINLEAHFYINPDDAEPFESVQLLYDDPIFAPEKDPSKTGYTFEGWSLDGETVVGDLGNMGDEDVIIYAIWSPNEYLASFDANGGFFADGSTKKVISVKYDTQIEFNEIPSRDFFAFNGWTPEPDSMNNINGINFRANWIHTDDVFYTVRTYVMGMDGKYTSTEKKYSGTVGETVTASYSVDSGFELNKNKSVLSGVVTTDCSLVLKIYLDRGLYDFYLNIDGVKTGETYLYGEPLPVPATPEKEGYVFLGWVPSIPETMPDSDYTVTATWKKTDSPDHAHSEKIVKVEPSCAETGRIYKICEICGEPLGEETVIPATGHKNGEWTVVTEPTYDSEGKKIKKCLTCGMILEEAKIDKLIKPSQPVTDYSKAVIEIRNKPENATFKYGETIRVFADTKDMPQGGYIEWSISGEGAVITNSDGEMCEIQIVSGGTVMLTATAVDADGEPLRGESGEKITDTQNITAKAGIIQKIIAFFKKLFGLNKVIVQTIKDL
ncbi:MAG: InlB B-repeat-containing protein [Clostridia bacterium]|nr:InlB B-repeat-containing protein [Clostridia bacterium]